jgi:hypothetical protein
MDNDNRYDDNVEESVVAKSTGQQEEKDIALKDAALYNVLTSKKKMTKEKAGYKEREKMRTKKPSAISTTPRYV